MSGQVQNKLHLGYNLDAWNELGMKLPITTDISESTNSHMLICGMSGSGKSFLQEQLFCKLKVANQCGEFYFADYKGDDSFAYLRQCSRYYSYNSTLDALDIVYSHLVARISGAEAERHPITLIWDEYMANILALTNSDKKRASEVMNKVSETLLMGRSMGIRLITSSPRADSIAYSAGARLNYGIVLVLGAAVRSIYEMLLPDFMDEVKGRQFGRGEGVCLLQGSDLRYIKVGQLTDKDTEVMRSICIKALS